MAEPAKETISIWLDADAVDSAGELGIDISAVVEAALVRAIAEQHHKNRVEADTAAEGSEAAPDEIGVAGKVTADGSGRG
jgi:post-segregation antitoxin (ccd killing protein)